MSPYKRFLLPILLALVKLALPFLLQHPTYQLHRDEYLYLAEGNHLDWGYMEVPPLLSLFSKLTLLLGGDIFWVKFWPSFFGAVTLLLICEMVYEMGGKLFAQLMAGLGLITAVYMRVHFMFQPTPLEILWWSAIALVMIKYINHRNNPRYLYVLGCLAGLSWLTKYSIVFYAAGIFAGILLTKHRRMFRQKHIYIAAAIAALLAIPNVLWQYHHSWPVLTHMKELRDTQLQYLSTGDFLKEQVLMHLSSFYYLIGGLIWLFFMKPGKPYRLLAWAYLTVIILLIVSSGKNYYSLGAYPALLAAGAVWLEQVTAASLKWLRYLSATATIFIGAYFTVIALPIWEPDRLAAYYKDHRFAEKGALKWEDLKNHPLPQDFADMLGWQEMAAKVSSFYGSLPDSVKQKTMIHCRNYGQAGAITYYGSGLPQVNTDNASFLFWMPDKYNVKHILLVTEKFPERDDIVFQQFEKHRVIDSVTNPLSREYGTKIIFFENGNHTLNREIETSVGEEKDRFRR